MKKKVLAALIMIAAIASCAFAEGGSIAGPDDLKGEKLAAQRGTTGQMIAEEILGDDGAKLLTTYERYADAIASLRRGRARAVIMDEAPARRFVEAADDLAILDEPLAIESYAIGFKKGSDLTARVDEALAAMKEEGIIASIIDKYLSGAEVSPSDIDLNEGASGGSLIMGTEAGFAPYELRVGDGFIGIDVEIMAEVARRLDRTLVIHNINFDALPMAVSSGKVDLIAAGITVTEERKKNLDFSMNYVEDVKQVAVVRKEDLAQR